MGEKALLRSNNIRFAERKSNSMSADQQKKLKSNFGLTQEEFNTLVEDLKAGDESLFETVFISHFKQALQYLMRKMSIEYDEAYDATMNTLLEFRLRLLNDKVTYGNLQFLFTQMSVQRFQRSKSKVLDKIRYSKEVEQNARKQENYDFLNKAISKLGEACQKIIEDYYFNDMSYKYLEKIHQKPSATLRKQKERCMTKLKMILRQATIKH